MSLENIDRLALLFSPADLGLSDALTEWERLAGIVLDVAMAQRPDATPEQWFQHTRAQLLELQLRQVLRGRTQASVSGGPSETYDRKLQAGELKREIRAAYGLAGLPVPGAASWNTPGVSVPVRATFGGGW